MYSILPNQSSIGGRGVGGAYSHIKAYGYTSKENSVLKKATCLRYARENTDVHVFIYGVVQGHSKVEFVHYCTIILLIFILYCLSSLYSEMSLSQSTETGAPSLRRT
jgi:hypothetical protein